MQLLDKFESDDKCVSIQVQLLVGVYLHRRIRLAQRTTRDKRLAFTTCACRMRLKLSVLRQEFRCT